jgi:ribosomal protein S27AE
MTTVTTWRTDDPCPACGTGLTLHDNGATEPRTECGLCGWSDTWTGDHANGGGQ